MNGLRHTPMYRALFRNQLLLGCDPKVLIIVALAAISMIVMVMRPLGIAAALIFFMISLYLLRLMGKADPLMRDVYRRHIEYQQYYPASSRPYRDAKSGREY